MTVRRTVSGRGVRALAVVLFALCAALWAPAAAVAEQPQRLPGQITDLAGALDAGQTADVQAAFDQLFDEHGVRMWVVYVTDFDGVPAETWGNQTYAQSSLDETRDGLLAVATMDRAYYFTTPSTGGIGQADADEIRHDAIEPALGAGDWAGGAIAAAGGVADAAGGGGGGMSVGTMVVGVGVGVAAIGGFTLYSRRRKTRLDQKQVEAARTVDPEDTATLATLPLPALDERARESLVEADEAVRASADELDIARGEFGDDATAQFAAALAKARRTLGAAFELRQRLDDAIPETPQQRREMLIEIISSCGRADRELDEKVDKWDAMRNLLITADEHIETLTQRVVAVSARLPESEATLTRLRTEFPGDVLSSIDDNVDLARGRLEFAEESVEQAREAVAQRVGQQGAAVVAIRAAESALTQADSLLDAVDHAQNDIRRAIGTLPDAMDDLQQGVTAAGTFDGRPGVGGQGAAALTTARREAEDALAYAEANKESDPLTSARRVAEADAALDAALEQVEQASERAEQARKRLDHDLLTAESQVTAAADFISTRRGAVGPNPRTRLTEAQRHLDAAKAARESDPATSLQHAQSAISLGHRALMEAQADVAEWNRRNRPPTSGHHRGGGSNAGAVLGGIVIGSILRGGGGGGFGGGGPRSFGGSGSSGRVGGGGRF